MTGDRITPATHPKHWVVGRTWNGWDSRVYYCEWYDPRYGYEMVEVAAPDTSTPVPGGRRTNISERAINGTYYRTDRRWGGAALPDDDER